jgi:hypothetical protein
MKNILSFILIIGVSSGVNAQYDSIFHEATFGKFSGVMHSNNYKVDNWEKSLFNNSEKAVFPIDIKENAEAFTGKLIHWIGVVQNISISTKNDSSLISILLDNKYWDYIEDYSVQDEVMFLSPKGGGQFSVVINSIKLTQSEVESLSKFPADKKLLLCYGLLIPNNENEIPILSAKGLKIVDYKLYSTSIFSYEIQRDKKNRVVKNKFGKTSMTNFQRLKVAQPGQNK